MADRTFSVADTLAGAPTTTTDSGAEAPRIVGGRYQILGLLGSGGMGSVYRARDVELDETVALKLLRRELSGAPAMLARFRQEVKLARRVTHTNVARVFDIGEDGADKFLTMEYIEGQPLSEVIAQRGALPLEEIRSVARALCDGLSAAHAAGVVHRDLKPDNILCGNRVVITDFGIARAFLEGDGADRTQGGLLGTPAYMAPEQVEGLDDIDERADVYALGAVLFELCTGERAWRGDAVLAVAAARLTQPPPDPRTRRAVPDPLAEVILRCLARRRDQRLGHAADVGAALETAFNSVSRWTPLPQAAPPAAPSSHDKSVAVLPFKNSGPAEDEYVADGLSEDLVDTLSMTRGLRVRPQSLVDRHRGDSSDPLVLGRALDVQVVIEGSIRRVGERTRVSARAIHVTDGFQIWAHRFDAAAGDLLMVSDRMAHSIAAALTAELSAPGRDGPSDPAAVELYLRARKELRNGWNDNPRKAIDLFKQAVDRAPSDANIIANHALALARGAFLWGGDEPLEAARAAAERAVTVAPDLGESWMALSSVRMYAADTVAAAQALRTGLHRAPTSGRLHDMVGKLAGEVGLVDEAQRHFDHALRLDPSLTEVHSNLARLFAMRGDWERADAMAEMPADEEATFLSRVVARARLAIWRDRPIEIPAPLVDRPRDHTIMLGLLEHARDIQRAREVRPETVQLLATMAKADRRRYSAFLWQLLAELAGSLGDPANVLDSIERALGTGLLDVHWLNDCPALAIARTDPRWPALAARVEANALPVRSVLSGI